MSFISISAFANSTSLRCADSNNTISAEINPVNPPSTIMALSFATSEDLYVFDREQI